MTKRCASFLLGLSCSLALSPAATAAEAPLVGSATVESNADSSSAGTSEAFNQIATASGTAEAAHLYIGSGNGAKTVVVGIYSNSGAHPGTLLSTGSAPATAAGTWTTVALSHVGITSGSTYWLAILGVGGTLAYRDHAKGPCASETSSQAGLTTLPSTWKTGVGYKDCPGSVYVTTATPVPAPVNSVAPVVSGVAEEGKTLSVTKGTWSGSPSSYATQWQDCNVLGEGCVNISNATTTEYKLGALDVGSTVRALITATNTGGSTTAPSTHTAIVVKAPTGNSVLLIGNNGLPHNNGGDAKTEEVTPLKFTALKSGTVEELYFESGGYKYAPSETSLVLGIQEDVGGKPGKVLGEGTVSGTLGLNVKARVAGLAVPIVQGQTYFLSFLPLGGSITYWYLKTETVIYSEHHKKLEEGPPEKYEWKEEAAEAPIGMWAMGAES